MSSESGNYLTAAMAAVTQCAEDAGQARPFTESHVTRGKRRRWNLGATTTTSSALSNPSRTMDVEEKPPSAFKDVSLTVDGYVLDARKLRSIEADGTLVYEEP